MADGHVPILPPAESHRAGIALIPALRARIAQAEKEWANWGWVGASYRVQALREALELAELTSSANAGAVARAQRYQAIEDDARARGVYLLLLLRDAGLVPRHVLIWVKNRPSFSIGRLDYDYQHEPIIYGWRPGGPHPWYAQESRVSVLPYDRPQASPLHPTAKPVALLAHLISNSTSRWTLRAEGC